MRERNLRERNVWKGVIAGAAAGLVATWAMTEFQQVWAKVSEEIKQQRRHEGVHSPERGTGDQEQSDDATMKVADRIARSVLNRGLTREEKKKAGPVVHYAFGVMTGAVYGAMAEASAIVTAGQGSVYASTVFVVGDEVAIPALKLSPPISESPLSSHLYGWVSHLVYGFTLERVRKSARSMMTDQGSERMLHAIRATAAGVRAQKSA